LPHLTWLFGLVFAPVPAAAAPIAAPPPLIDRTEFFGFCGVSENEPGTCIQTEVSLSKFVYCDSAVRPASNCKHQKRPRQILQASPASRIRFRRTSSFVHGRDPLLSMVSALSGRPPGLSSPRRSIYHRSNFQNYG
jgi:hypothetical protein